MLFAQSSSRTLDLNLERRIVNYLVGKHVSALRYLNVEANNGVVTLRGRVHSFHQKQLCLNCCQRVAGVVEIDDQIEVNGRPQ